MNSYSDQESYSESDNDIVQTGFADCYSGIDRDECLHYNDYSKSLWQQGWDIAKQLKTA